LDSWARIDSMYGKIWSAGCKPTFIVFVCAYYYRNPVSLVVAIEPALLPLKKVYFVVYKNQTHEHVVKCKPTFIVFVCAYYYRNPVSLVVAIEPALLPLKKVYFVVYKNQTHEHVVKSHANYQLR